MENTEDAASNKTNEEIKDISETDEQNNEVESSTIFKGINDEHPEEQHDQHIISSSDMKKMSEECHHSSHKTSSQPKSHPSVGQYSLRSNTASVKHGKEIDSEISPPLVSRRTGKPLCNNFNQTSLIWEKKPLAEILHPKIPPRGGDTDKHTDAEDHVPPSAGDIENKQASFEISQSVEGEESKNDDQLSKEEESTLSNQPREMKLSQDSTKSIPTPGEYYYDPESSCPEGLQIKFEEPVQEKKPPRLQQITAEEGGVWISQKTGKEVRSNFNQTSLIWEKKPLAEILQRSSTKNKTSNPDEAQSPED